MLKKPQKYNPFWVRKRIFRCLSDEVDDYYNWINSNKNFLIYGYGNFHYLDEGVNIPVYYLEKADLTEGNPYIQCEDWQKHPWDAPADGVDWNSASN